MATKCKVGKSILPFLKGAGQKPILSCLNVVLCHRYKFLPIARKISTNNIKLTCPKQIVPQILIHWPVYGLVLGPQQFTFGPLKSDFFTFIFCAFISH